MSDQQTTALAIRPRNYQELCAMARDMCLSTIVARELQHPGAAPNVGIMLLSAMEMGQGPGWAMRNLTVIKGRVCMYAEGMHGIVLASGKAKYVKRTEYTDSAVTWATERDGDTEPRVLRFTIDEAHAEGLTRGDTYKRMPKRMLSARALSRLLRDTYPDVFGCGGVYGVEEMTNSEEHDGGGYIDAEMATGSVAFAMPELGDMPLDEYRDRLGALYRELPPEAEDARAQVTTRGKQVVTAIGWEKKLRYADTREQLIELAGAIDEDSRNDVITHDMRARLAEQAKAILAQAKDERSMANAHPPEGEEP